MSELLNSRLLNSQKNMNTTRHIAIDEFDYPLPDERIAKFPLAQRDSSKLLLYRGGEVSEDSFTSLPEHLPSGALMVFNNTRVIQARLHFRKDTGALIEVFCLEPLCPNEYVQMFAQTERCSWLCLVGNLSAWPYADTHCYTWRGGGHGASRRLRLG